MTDLERLFQQLVAALATADPARLNRPVALGDIRDSILPYRMHRRALGLDTIEDYDLLLLRLAAGDGGFARTSPEEVRARFASEVAGTNPDLGLLRRHADAWLTLEGLRVARALAATDDDPYAPPEPDPESDLGRGPVLDLEVARPAQSRAEPAPGLMCLFCGATLPSGRTVNFCPSCGQSQTTPRCPQCQTEVELGWRHCVNCGAALAQL
ncbi:MAG: zinc ribbon domain-containing protein [Gemmatimonadales bacterium]